MMGEEKKSRGVKRIGGLRRSRGVEEWRLSGVYSSAGCEDLYGPLWEAGAGWDGKQRP